VDKARIAAHLEQGDVDLFIGAAEDVAGGLIGRTLFDDEFVTAQRKDNFTAKLLLTPNCRAAPRREPPASTNATTRSRKSDE
jgi:DNA-binding transcriptional LysR family regulator